MKFVFLSNLDSKATKFALVLWASYKLVNLNLVNTGTYFFSRITSSVIMLFPIGKDISSS